MASNWTGVHLDGQHVASAPRDDLQYSLSGDAAAVDKLSAVWIHAGSAAKPGAARHQLFGADRAPAGTVTLAAADRRDLAEGGLLARFYLRNGRGSAADVQVSFEK